MLLDKVKNTYNKLILLGDFNIDLLPTALQKTSWINTFQRYYLTQLTVYGNDIDSPESIGNELNQNFTTVINELIDHNGN